MKKGILPISRRYDLKNLIHNFLTSVSDQKERLAASDPIMSQILHNRSIDIVFQAIVTLNNYNILGYEALARGPLGSIYEKPLQLLSAADDRNCRLEVETICHKSAISAAAKDLGGRCLFINVSPKFIDPKQYSPGKMLNFLEQYCVDPHQIILELTERNHVNDFTALNRHLDIYRNQGIRIAIDDAGAGYSSLQAIAELQPDFVKMDLSLVRDIHKNQVKQAILETISNLCAKIKADIICEGIEHAEELRALQELGCPYGQGFLFDFPGHIHSKPQERLLSM